MLRSFFTFLGRLYNLVISLILAVALGFVVWGSWGLYREEKLTSQFHREGKPVRVKVQDTSSQQRSWRDYLGRIAYLSFHYQQRPYEARFVMDTLYVGTGDQVDLLYHAGMDAFRQPNEQFRFHQFTNTSRLIHWSVVGTFSLENRWLVACLMLSGCFFFFVSAILVSLTGWNIFSVIGRFVFGCLLVGGALFFTYDSWEYFRYYRQIKANGREATTKVIDTDRSSYSTHQSRHWKWYRYSARVRFQNRERIIPLEEADYEVLKPGDSLPVLYNASMDELIPVNYSLDYRQFFIVGFLCLFGLIFLWKTILPSNRTPKEKYS